MPTTGRHRRARAAPAAAASPPAACSSSTPSSPSDALFTGVRLSVLLVGLAPALALAAGERTMHCRTDADCQRMFPGSVDYVCCFQLSCNDNIRYFKEYSGCSPKRKCPEKAKHNQLAGLGMHFATRLHHSNYTKHKTAVEKGASGKLCEQLMRSVRDQGVPIEDGKTGKTMGPDWEPFTTTTTTKKPPKPPGATEFKSGIKFGPPEPDAAAPPTSTTSGATVAATAAPRSITERLPIGKCACPRGRPCCVRVDCDLSLGVAEKHQWAVDDYCSGRSECALTKDVGKPSRHPYLEQYYMSPDQWALRKDAKLQQKYLFGDVERDCTEMDVFYTALRLLQRAT